MPDGYPVDNFRPDPDHDRVLPDIDPGHKVFTDERLEQIKDSFPKHTDKPFTEADLMRLAGQLERAEEQGFRFERYARCGVGGHRHRWAVTSWICQLWRYLKGG